VKSLIDSNLEKFKNLWEESHFYWGEIEARTLKFDRVDSEVSVLLSALMHVKEIVSNIKQTDYSNFSKLLSVVFTYV
jgi:secreted Zn-dependent insulinase-like peptidase